MMNPLMDGARWEKTSCESCGEIVWLFHSRVLPLAYSDAQFQAEFQIIEEMKEIRHKDPQARHAFDERYRDEALRLLFEPR